MLYLFYPGHSEDFDLIQHARRSLLFDNEEPWVKKQEENFDVTMGAYDGVEVCEIGMYLLSLLGEKYNNKEIGLYRDDGLSVFKNINGPEAEKIKEDIQRISCNMKVVNYLDVTFNLNDESYRPYHKTTDGISFIKQLPISIESRLSKLLSSKEIFKQSAKMYQEALIKCGYKHKLIYKPNSPENRSAKNNRKRKMIWFNQPYSKSVSTNVAKSFLNLVNKHFPPHHKFRKHFKKNTMEVRYS